jgi:hypothetical protein
VDELTNNEPSIVSCPTSWLGRTLDPLICCSDGADDATVAARRPLGLTHDSVPEAIAIWHEPPLATVRPGGNVVD